MNEGGSSSVTSDDLWSMFDRINESVKDSHKALSEEIKSQMNAIRKEVEKITKRMDEDSVAIREQFKELRDRDNELEQKNIVLCGDVAALRERLNFYRWVALGALSFSGGLLLTIVAAFVNNYI